MSVEVFTQMLYRALIRKYATTAASDSGTGAAQSMDEIDDSILMRVGDERGAAGTLNAATVVGLVKVSWELCNF